MRFLFAFVGGYGHFEPLIPIARVALARGHDVLFTCKPAMVEVVRSRGFDCVVTPGDTGSAMTERYPLQRFDIEREEDAVRSWFAGTAARVRAAGCEEVARGWRADAIVSDEVDFGARLAGERLGLACASVVVIAAGGFLRDDVVASPLARVRAELGLPPMAPDAITVAPIPPSLRDPMWPLPGDTLWIRPGALEPADSDVVDGTIWLTLGTEFNREAGDLFERALAAVSGLGMPVLVTVGHGVDPAELGTQAGHVRVERYLPMAAVLPRARLVVSHGGSGILVGTLAHGVPTVVFPMGADQGLNAARVEALGVGRALDAVDATIDDIAAAVRQVIDDAGIGARVRAIAGEARALDDPSVVVDALERVRTG